MPSIPIAGAIRPGGRETTTRAGEDAKALSPGRAQGCPASGWSVPARRCRAGRGRRDRYTDRGVPSRRRLTDMSNPQTTREVQGVVLHLSAPDTTEQDWIGQDEVLK